MVPALRECLDRLGPGETGVVVTPRRLPRVGARRAARLAARRPPTLRGARQLRLGRLVEPSPAAGCGWRPTTSRGPPAAASPTVRQRPPISQPARRLAKIPALPSAGSGRRGCGAAGSAPAWHAGGQGFESPQLHQKPRRSDGPCPESSSEEDRHGPRTHYWTLVRRLRSTRARAALGPVSTGLGRAGAPGRAWRPYRSPRASLDAVILSRRFSLEELAVLLWRQRADPLRPAQPGARPDADSGSAASCGSASREVEAWLDGWRPRTLTATPRRLPVSAAGRAPRSAPTARFMSDLAVRPVHGADPVPRRGRPAA